MKDTPQYKASIERSEAKVEDLRKCITEQTRAISVACDKMLADHRNGKKVSDELTYWQKRAESLKGYYKTIDTEHEYQKEQMSKERDRLEQAVRAEYEKMRGLTSYALGTGQGSPELQLLHDSLGDVLDAKNGPDREDARKTVDLCLKFAKFGNEAKLDTGILDEYESIADPEHSSAFYKQHEATIKAQYQLRIDAANSTKESK
jgi:hypothetical protein